MTASIGSFATISRKDRFRSPNWDPRPFEAAAARATIPSGLSPPIPLESERLPISLSTGRRHGTRHARGDRLHFDLFRGTRGVRGLLFQGRELRAEIFDERLGFLSKRLFVDLRKAHELAKERICRACFEHGLENGRHHAERRLTVR